MKDYTMHLLSKTWKQQLIEVMLQIYIVNNSLYSKQVMQCDKMPCKQSLII